MYKIGQKVRVDNRFSSYPEDNRGVIIAIRIQYIVKLDGGLVGKFDSEKITKLKELENVSA